MKELVRLSGIINDSIVDGLGIRMTIFTQGCPHHCKGCHNPQTHDFSGGYDEEIQTIYNKIKGNPLLNGITLSGGEPFCQGKALAELCRLVKKDGLNVWAYSGYTFEQLLENPQEGALELLKECDVLVDGKYIEAERDLELLFRGSRNQRILDVKASFKEKKAVLLKMDD